MFEKFKQIEKEDARKIQIFSSLIVGSLAVSTISGGFFLVYCDYVSAADFFSGVGIGFGSSAVVASIGACAVSARFFKPEPLNIQEDQGELISEDDYLLNFKSNI